MTVEKHRFTQIDFQRFKAFQEFTVQLRHFNILVGPNNAGKSTILAAFRILAAAMRKAGTRKPEMIRGPNGRAPAYRVDLRTISVAEENIFFNYDDREVATIRFRLSNKSELVLYFPETNECYLFPETASGRDIQSPAMFKREFNCDIGFVPILGPVEHIEPLFEEEAARRALFSYQAARNFRNIWYHYPQRFSEFRSILQQTWPGMDIEAPIIEASFGKPRLYMFCPEDRIPREIFWSGFGFQVWCQMLTHLIQSSDKSIFLIDEPDIYLHSELQRQLLGLLRNLGPDILVATHSTEIVSEAEPDDIVLIDKKRKSARRIKDPSQLQSVFSSLGSNLNPILTQLAKTRRALFVEGDDFQIAGKLARRLGSNRVGNRSDFAVVPVKGFNPERIRSLKEGMELTLGSKILSAAILDKDYRSDAECKSITEACEAFCEFVFIHPCKEIENYLLSPRAIEKAAQRRSDEHAKRGGMATKFTGGVATILDKFSAQKKAYVTAQYLEKRKLFERRHNPKLDGATINELVLADCEAYWTDPDRKLQVIPGKDALSAVNKWLQEGYKISVTPAAIIDAMSSQDVSDDCRKFIKLMADFSASNVSD